MWQMRFRSGVLSDFLFNAFIVGGNYSDEFYNLITLDTRKDYNGVFEDFV